LQHELILIPDSRKSLIVLILLVFTVFSLSCFKQAATSFKTVKKDSPITEIPKDWQKIETDDFSFSIPPTMKNNNVQGFDSFAMQFENAEIKLDIEYGDYFADIISQLRDYEGQKELITIDGEKTELITYDQNKPIYSTNKTVNAARSPKSEKVEKNYVIGVNFPNSMKSFHQSAISFVARYKNLEAQETAKTIFQSIKFKQK
jgi:hypothetical protein